MFIGASWAKSFEKDRRIRSGMPVKSGGVFIAAKTNIGKTLVSALLSRSTLH